MRESLEKASLLMKIGCRNIGRQMSFVRLMLQPENLGNHDKYSFSNLLNRVREEQRYTIVDAVAMTRYRQRLTKLI